MYLMEQVLVDVLYNDMGLAKPVGMPEQTDISLPVVTYEGLASIQADYIFVMATDEELAQIESKCNLEQLTCS